MNRRRFLQFSAALSAAGVPLSVACRIGGAEPPGNSEGPDGKRPIPEIDEDEPLASALKRARRLGKPLLVFAISEDDNEQWNQGRLFGSLLNHGADSTLVDLSLCEVICASTDEIDRELDDARLEDEPVMILVETGGDEYRSDPVIGDLPPLVENDWETDEDELSESMKARLETLAEWLHETVLPKSSTLARRGEEAHASLSGNERVRLRRLGKRALERSELVDRAAATLLASAIDGKLSEKDTREALALSAAKRLREAPPYGAKWAVSTGCGCEIEGEDSSGLSVACGMAFIPELGQRFLAFYV